MQPFTHTTQLSTRAMILIGLLSALALPAHSRDFDNRRQTTNVSAGTSTSVSITNLSFQQPTDIIGSTLCGQANAAAIQGNHRPIGDCGYEEPLDYNTSVNTNDVETGNEEVQERDVVIFVHGFNPSGSVGGGHDCNEYWGAQRVEMEETHDWIVNVIGYYPNNTNCEDLDGVENFGVQTPIEDVALSLRNFIVDNYGEFDRVSLVAHSLGGIVARKMLDDYGYELDIKKVVTVASPHAGVFSIISNCQWILQCTQVNPSSDFMNALEHNPQGINGTKWSLIATDRDRIIGKGTGTLMNRGGSWKPEVSTHTYRHYHKNPGHWDGLAHGDLHGENATVTVRRYYSDGTYSITKEPHQRIIDALME